MCSDRLYYPQDESGFYYNSTYTKLYIEGAPLLRKRRLLRTFHVELLQFLLDGVELLAWVLLYHCKLVKLPEIDFFFFIDS